MNGNTLTNEMRMIMYKTEHGIDIDTELYTYSVWKKKGYQVKKGEKAKHKVALWKYTSKKVKNEKTGEEQISGKCFPKMMSLFEISQVEKID